MITTQEPAASPMQAEFAPMHHYAEAYAAMESGWLSFFQAARSLAQAQIVFVQQQTQLFTGLGAAMASALPHMAEPRGVDDLLNATFRAAEAFDTDPRWTTPPH